MNASAGTVPQRPISPSAGGAASEPAGAAILDIVQSLGLKLEARNLPVPLLVIDHLEKMPTDN